MKVRVEGQFEKREVSECSFMFIVKYDSAAENWSAIRSMLDVLEDILKPDYELTYESTDLAFHVKIVEVAK